MTKKNDEIIKGDDKNPFPKNLPLVSIVMGSDSDLTIMKDASEVLNQFDIIHEVKIVSAHRTPEFMFEYAKSVQQRGIKIIIAGAGGSAHLPGMIASLTSLPVIGVPIKSSNSLIGIDSLLSIVQMPAGIPVATVAINGARNAGILACSILAIYSSSIQSKISQFKEKMKQEIRIKDEQLNKKGIADYLLEMGNQRQKKIFL
jgi:5-(carboxyamino)imidazole ribonucleotide mutase